MNCERALEQLSPFLDSELPDADTGAVRSHLDACPPCKHAHGRLVRLETISVTILRGAPDVAVTEWSARWIQIDGACVNPAAQARRAKRERNARLSIATFAMAAAVIIAATLALPMLAGRFEAPDGPIAHHHGPAAAAHLAYNSTPGANHAEVLELTSDDDYSVGVSYPREESGDPVVITVSKLY
jgi:anti-sigma factor RsiW